MAMQDLFSQIEEKYGEMSKSFIKISDFILTMKERTLLYSANKLADYVGVSNATVIRFAQFMGYSGYDELKRALVAATTDQTRQPGDFAIASEVLGAEHEYIQVAFQYEQECLNNLIQSFSYEKVDQSINAIERARKIYFLGIGSSLVPAYNLYFSFDRLQLNCGLLNFGGSMLMEKLTFFSSDDVLVVVSFPRYSVDTFEAMKRAHENGGTVILISDGGSESLSEYADIEFVVSSNNPFLMYNSNTGTISLCNILVLEYCYRNYDSCKKILQQITGATQQFRIKD